MSNTSHWTKIARSVDVICARSEYRGQYANNDIIQKKKAKERKNGKSMKSYNEAYIAIYMRKVSLSVTQIVSVFFFLFLLPL